MHWNSRQPSSSQFFWRPTAAAASAITLVALPGFLLGAFAPQIKEELNFGDTELGALLTFGYLISSITMQVGGGIADRKGPLLILRIGIAVAAISAVLTGSTADTYLTLLLCLGLNRVAEGMIHPATNTLISIGVEPSRQGIAMAIKQSAIPLSTALAGFAVPTLGPALGWKGTFLILAIFAFPAWILVPRVAVSTSERFPTRREMWSSRHLQAIGLAGAFSAAAVVTVSGFLTTAATEAGYSDSSAGLILGLGGFVMILSRLAWGYLADHFQFDRFRAVAISLALGSVAFVLFAVGTKITILVGALFIFGIGWSWPGLLLLGVIEQHPEEPGAATATLQTSIRLGAMIAPIGFGAITDAFGFSVAWLTAFSSTVLGSLLMFAASRTIGRR